MKLVISAAVLFLSACGPEFPEPGETEREALDLVWHEWLGETEDPPHVYWLYDIECMPPPVEGHCVIGTFDSQSWSNQVIWFGTIGRGAYAHEMMHAHQHLQGTPEPRHERAEDWDFVKWMGEQLRLRGL